MVPFPPAGLAARLLAVLPQSKVVRHRIASGACVFHQGDVAAAVFVVESGRVRLARILEDGSPLILFVADAGDSFAEASLSASHYHCDATAETDATVLALPRAELLASLSADPAESLALALALAAQVRDLRARLELRNIRSATARTLAWLRLHAAGKPPSAPVNRTWTLIAGEIGLTREALYRALAMLERQGLIVRRSGSVDVTIPGEEGLKAPWTS